MVIRAIYPPCPYHYDRIYNYFEPRIIQTYSILEILIPVTPISEKGTEFPYHESYRFCTNPVNTVTYEDIIQLPTQLFGEEFEYPIASHTVDNIWHTRHKPVGSQDTGFSIPSVWEGNKR